MKITLETVEVLDKATGGLFAFAEKALAENNRGAAEVLLRVLPPLFCMGAVCETQGQRALDLTPLRRFFLGVLGWPPKTLLAADLADLAAAFSGYARRHGMIRDTDAPGRGFMDDMMARFPDLTEGGTR